MMNLIHNLKRIAAGILSLTLLHACTTEEFQPAGNNLNLKEGEVALQLVPAQMGIYQVDSRGKMTRAEEPKNAEEQKIHTVHLFIFNENGEYLKAKDADKFQGYQYLEGSQNFILNREMFDEASGAGNAIIYAFANMPKDQFGEVQTGGYPEKVPDMQALDQLTFTLPEFGIELPEGGLPMSLKQTGVVLTSDSDTRVIALKLRALMARIDLDFQMVPSQESDNGRNPSLSFSSVEVNGFPKGTAIVPQLERENITSDTETDDETYGIELTQNEPVSLPALTGKVFRKGEPLEGISLYIFEHARNGKPITEVFPEGEYPDNIEGPENEGKNLKQRYKNSFAKEDAASLILHGTYRNHNNHNYTVTYTLYPGATTIGDEEGAFTLKPNRLYKNRITVTGITANNIGDEALLDTRVNIDETANPYFIEMLRERKHDAHFNITPMDIYMDEGATMKVEILPGDDGTLPDWIRMEPMRYSPTSNGAVAAVNAGEGKREYFTTTLMDELRRHDNDAEPWSILYTATEREERIYFYIDENVPDANLVTEKTSGRTTTMDYSQLPEQVPARSAMVRITYTPKAGTQESREIKIEQSGMYLVRINKFSDGGPFDQNNEYYQPYAFYIENHEEYLMHYDGKNKFSNTHEGFLWGNQDMTFGLVSSQGAFAYYLLYGWYNTTKIVKRSNQETMTLNDVPRSAAEYCFNKNIRNPNTHKVDDIHWYLPTISELEYALEYYYGMYDVFQNKWYWSSNPGEVEGNNRQEDPDHARATKVQYDPSYDGDDTVSGDKHFRHFRSDPDYPFAEGKGGYATRDNAFRIRAAYIVKAPVYRRNSTSEDIPTLKTSDVQ